MRWLLIGVIVVLLLAAAAYLAVGYVVYAQATTLAQTCKALPNRPDAFAGNEMAPPGFDFAPYFMPGYRAVRFASRDPGIEIAGWDIPAPAPGAPAVIVVGGMGGCRCAEETLMPAGMLHRRGFRVLVIDLRDTGDSTFEDGHTAMGNEEYQDVLGAFDWLVSEQGIPPQKVGLFGNSMGAAAVLNAFAEEPRVAAIFLNSPWADPAQLIREQLAKGGYPALLAPGGLLMARIVAGDNLTAHSPLRALDRHAGRPIYLVHSLDDAFVPVAHAQQLEVRAHELGANVTAWYLPSALHVAGYITYPEEFEERMAAFFRAALGA
jgi:uncharacterized protein